MNELESLKCENECLKKELSQYAERFEEMQEKYNKADEELRYIRVRYREAAAESEGIKFAIRHIFGAN